MEASPRDLFDSVAKSITIDREIGTFDQPEAQEVSWLMKDPETVEEIAVNIYERLRAIGVTFELPKEGNEEAIDGVALMGAYIARKRAMNEPFAM